MGLREEMQGASPVSRSLSFGRLGNSSFKLVCFSGGKYLLTYTQTCLSFQQAEIEKYPAWLSGFLIVAEVIPAYYNSS